MLNEDQLKLKQIQRRMTSLTSSMESFQTFLLSLPKTSEPSPGLLCAAAATSDLVSLMMAAAAVSQSEMDRLYWTNDLARLRNLKGLWHTACENLSDALDAAFVTDLSDDDCECDD